MSLRSRKEAQYGPNYPAQRGSKNGWIIEKVIWSERLKEKTLVDNNPVYNPITVLLNYEENTITASNKKPHKDSIYHHVNL
jgi:hypothetical protein